MASSEGKITTRPKDVEKYVDRFLSTTCDASRRHILEYLSISPQNTDDPAEHAAGDIAAHLGLAASTTSEHLKELLKLHLLATRKEGKKVYYSLRNRDLVQAFHDLVNALEDHYQCGILPPANLEDS